MGGAAGARGSEEERQSRPFYLVSLSAAHMRELLLRWAELDRVVAAKHYDKALRLQRLVFAYEELEEAIYDMDFARAAAIQVGGRQAGPRRLGEP